MAFWQAVGNFLQGAIRNAFPLFQVGGQLVIQDKQQEIQKNQIELSKRSQDNQLEIAKMRVDEVKATLAAKGVELQAQLAEKAKDRELTVQEKNKDRALTEFLKKLEIEAQMIIHKENIEQQKWRVEKETELMYLRSGLEGQNQIALSIQQLKNAIAQMKEKRKIDNSPIRNLACDLVEEWERLDDPCALMMLYSPPVIHHETSALVAARTPQDFPDCEYELEHDLLHFQLFYNSKGRPIVLKTAEWISKYNRGTAAISPIYSEANMIPTVIMDIAANNDKAFFNIAYWEPHFKKYEYFPATSKPLSWRNLAENTVAYFSITSQLWLGILADLHYLIHVPIDRRQTPLLPSLLPDLISSLPETEQIELIKIVISHYESVYSALAELQPLLIADLRLDLAIAFSQLPSQMGAKQQLQASMHNWLRMYNLRVEDDFDILITSVDSLLSISDRAYVNKLNVCLSAIGETRQLNIVTSCYQRGIRRNQTGEYGAARADFDQVISLNSHADAYFQRGLAFLGLEDYQSSICDLLKASELQPISAKIYDLLGDIYLKLGSYKVSIDYYKKAFQYGYSNAKIKIDSIRQLQTQANNIPVKLFAD
jgi:tetratricopeptide (TPR) repeat protein